MERIILLSENSYTKLMNNKFLTIFLFSFLLNSITFAQDTTRSDVFRNDFPQKHSIIKAKYPSYSLIAGYILTSEANRGDPFAQHELGLRYLLGNGFAKDTAKAIYWIKKAVDQNLPAAKFNYGIMLYNGIGVPWNPFEAYQNFKAASDALLPEAQFALALLYTDNLVVSRDYNKAYKLFSLAAKAKYKPAEEALKQLLSSGFIPPSDSTINLEKRRIDESAQMLKSDWDLDFIDFEKSEKDTSENFVKEIFNKKAYELRNLFGIEKFDSTKNDTSAISLIISASENGSPEALYILGRMYELGIIYKKDLSQSASFLLRAYRLGSFKAGEILYKLVQNEQFINSLKEKVKKNEPDAMYAWAAITALGFSNQLAISQAIDLLNKAVEKNHIPSLIEIGLLYFNGTSVQKKKNKAYEYWEAAQKLGSKESSVRLALAKINESHKEEEKIEYVKTIKTIAEEGSVFAQTALAYCYEKGLGVKENKVIAIKLYRNAAQRGSQAAYNSLRRMYDEIRPEEETFKIYEIKN